MTAGAAVQHFIPVYGFFDTADCCQPQRPNRALLERAAKNTMDGDDFGDLLYMFRR